MEKQEIYTDESVFKIGGTSFLLKSIPKIKLLRIYRKQKKNPEKLDLALINYVEKNIETWRAEAVARGFRGLVDSLDQLALEYIKNDKPKVVKVTPSIDPELSRKEKFSQICETGKIIFLTRKDAKESLAKARNTQQGHKKPIRSYECDKCNWWHLTSISIEEWRNKK